MIIHPRVKVAIMTSRNMSCPMRGMNLVPTPNRHELGMGPPSEVRTATVPVSNLLWEYYHQPIANLPLGHAPNSVASESFQDKLLNSIDIMLLFYVASPNFFHPCSAFHLSHETSADRLTITYLRTFELTYSRWKKGGIHGGQRPIWEVCKWILVEKIA